MTTPRMLFVNLPVEDLEASKAFFRALGFEFEPRFTDEKAACMVVDPSAAFVMLLSAPFFDTFTPRQRCDTSTHCEGLFALSCSSRQEVDALASAALEAGGALARPSQDHGFMYAKSFYDLDGHQWEVLWMDTTERMQEG